MSMSNLAKKLQIRTNHQVLLVNPPENYSRLLDPLPENVKIFTKAEGNFDMIQLFVLDSSELSDLLKWIKEILLPNTIFWIAYPKKSSGVKSDLDMMSSWTEPEKLGYRPVAAVAIDETWTALRFKPSNQVKKSEISSYEIPNNELGKYIDIKNHIITVPPELEAELALNPGTLLFFESLAWSHKKEYISWILSAKQEKTKINRIKKTADMLAAKKKNPSEK